jgi:hypothetical protein
MVASNPVVDISVDPLDERRRRHRALLRIGIPLGGVALMIATILFIAFYADVRTNAAARNSEDLNLVASRQGQQRLSELASGSWTMGRGAICNSLAAI